MIADLRRMQMPLAQIERALASSDAVRNAIVREHVERLETAVVRAHSIAQTLGAQPKAQETTMNPTNPAQHDVFSSTSTLDARSLGQAIDQILPAVGTSAASPHLMCVLIESKDGSIRFVGTDSHRLSIRDIVPSGHSDEYRTVVAAETIRDWGTALREPSDVVLAIDGSAVTVTGDGVDLSASTVPVTFPDYESILNPAKDRDGTTVVVGRDQLLSGFDSFERSGAVLMSTSSDAVTLQRREVRLDLAASCDGPEVHVALDPSYAADALRAAVGAEAVVEIVDALSPVVFRSADDGTCTTLLMPVKLD